MEDITIRALVTLQSSDFILCEDTRVSRKLLAHYGIKTKLYAYHDHNGEHIRPMVMDALKAGKIISLISDAGTPLVSDPGYKLVQAALDFSIFVSAVPGPSSILAALVSSGLPPYPFAFGGFLPSKAQARLESLRQFSTFPGTVIFFESASRLLNTLNALEEKFSERSIVVARELTKKFEEICRGSLESILSEMRDHSHLRGEIVLLIGPPQGEENKSPEIENIKVFIQEQLNQGRSVKDILTHVMEKFSGKKNAIYKQILDLKKNENP